MSFIRINKVLSTILLILVICCCHSCKKGPCYRYDISELDLDSINSELLVGTKLPINMTDVDAFYCMDSIILIHNAPGSAFPYTVYNSVTYDSIISFGRKGRARNEFISNPVNITKQVFKRNGDCIVPLMDNDVCKEVNLTKTIEKKSTIIERVSEGINFLQGTAIFYGNDYRKQFVFVNGRSDEMYAEGERLPYIYYIDENDDVKQTTVYSRYPENNTEEQASTYYYGVIYKQPEGNIVAQPLYRMNYILFYDIENRKYHALHVKGRRSFEDGIPEDENEQNSMAFLDDAAPADDFLFVLYMGDYDDVIKEDPKYKGRVLQIDWNGNLIKSFILHDWVNRLTYDTSSHILYGSNYWFGDLYSFGVID